MKELGEDEDRKKRAAAEAMKVLMDATEEA
jgi:hypothetical protein